MEDNPSTEVSRHNEAHRVRFATSVSPQSSLQICAASQWARVADRDRFRQMVADELADSSLAGCVERAVAAAFLTYWQECARP